MNGVSSAAAVTLFARGGITAGHRSRRRPAWHLCGVAVSGYVHTRGSLHGGAIASGRHSSLRALVAGVGDDGSACGRRLGAPRTEPTRHRHRLLPWWASRTSGGGRGTPWHSAGGLAACTNGTEGICCVIPAAGPWAGCCCDLRVFTRPPHPPPTPQLLELLYAHADTQRPCRAGGWQGGQAIVLREDWASSGTPRCCTLQPTLRQGRESCPSPLPRHLLLRGSSPICAHRLQRQHSSSSSVSTAATTAAAAAATGDGSRLGQPEGSGAVPPLADVLSAGGSLLGWHGLAACACRHQHGRPGMCSSSKQAADCSDSVRLQTRCVPTGCCARP